MERKEPMHNGTTRLSAAKIAVLIPKSTALRYNFNDENIIIHKGCLVNDFCRTGEPVRDTVSFAKVK